MKTAQKAYTFPNEATPEGSSAYYIVRFSPEHLRNRQAVLFAWLREIERLLTLQEQHVAEVKTDWWRREIEERFTDSRHPLCSALYQHVGEQACPLLLEMLNGIPGQLNDSSPLMLDRLATYVGANFSKLLTLPYEVSADELDVVGQVGHLDYMVRHAMQSGDSGSLEHLHGNTRRPSTGPAVAQLAITERLVRRARQPGRRAELLPLELLWLVWRNRRAMRQ